MTKIRELFHKIGNCHNKISIGAGVAKDELEQTLKEEPIPDEIKKTIERLSQLEQYAIEASKTLNELKDIIYVSIDPDTGKPK